MSKDQVRLLRFAIKYSGWHHITINDNGRTLRTVKTLVKHKLLELNEYRQFRLFRVDVE